MRLLYSSLPLLNSEWWFLDVYDWTDYMTPDYDNDVPTCYGKAPFSSPDGREYCDVDASKVRTINLRPGVGIQSLAQAELYLYDHYRFRRLLDKKVTRGGTLYSFKVEND